MNFQLQGAGQMAGGFVQLSDGVYDCFVLGDLDYRAIDAAGAKAIADQVGAGLVTLGGFSSYGAGGWDESPLSEILPIK